MPRRGGDDVTAAISSLFELIYLVFTNRYLAGGLVLSRPFKVPCGHRALFASDLIGCSHLVRLYSVCLVQVCL